MVVGSGLSSGFSEMQFTLVQFLAFSKLLLPKPLTAKSTVRALATQKGRVNIRTEQIFFMLWRNQSSQPFARYSTINSKGHAESKRPMRPETDNIILFPWWQLARYCNHWAFSPISPCGTCSWRCYHILLALFLQLILQFCMQTCSNSRRNAQRSVYFALDTSSGCCVDINALFVWLALLLDLLQHSK